MTGRDSSAFQAAMRLRRRILADFGLDLGRYDPWSHFLRALRPDLRAELEEVMEEELDAEADELEEGEDPLG